MRFIIFILAGVFFTLSIAAQKHELKFHKNKTFKIVQFTDAHIIAGDTNSFGAVRTIVTVLDLEKPDLVVFTGDIVVESQIELGWEMVTSPVISRKIPFAVVFGNHDDEGYLNRKQLAHMIEDMPYSLLVPKADSVTGYGNYSVRIQSAKNTKTSFVLYFIDSNAYVTSDPKSGYNWIQPDQIAWYERESNLYTKINNGKPISALAFFHIPLPEYNQAYRNEAFPPVGLRLENECSPKYNSGMFNAMVKCGDVMGVFTGHDHDNDYLAYLQGIALAYGRVTATNTTYGVLSSGGRVIELTEGRKSFKTWIRTGTGEIFLKVRFPDDFIKN
jgi:3',5'-cyclic AMP phosphodiesterase CpdA